MHLLFALSLLACETGPKPADPAEIEMAEDGGPKVPVDVAAPPEDALKTSTGIPYKVLVPGEGKVKPVAEARVEVHYAGWTTDGKQFDSSYSRQRTHSFSLQQVISGWTEGLQEMVEGERRIFWIPEEKAYQGKAGKPKGMLVFDIHLLKVTNPPVLAANQYTAPSDGNKLASGITIKTLEAGTGTEKPKPDARVKAHFTGWNSEGRFVQSSKDLARVPEFRLTQVIPGWSEAFQQMVAGEKARVWIPKELTLMKGAPPPQTEPQDMIFDLELFEVTQSQPPPENVAAAPSDAKTTASGLSYKVLATGSGGPKPTKQQTVEVHYTGWTTDGLMFDSSLDRGKPTTLGVAQVIEGWTEALEMMSVGDKWRVWIPEELAYKGRRGSPQGMLVFDIELVAIKDRTKAPARAPHPVPPQPGR